MAHQGFDRLAALAAPLHLAEPINIEPPSPRRPNWILNSDSQNWTYEPVNFAKVKKESFRHRRAADRVFGVGVAAHKEQLFGWFNQLLLGLVTAIGHSTLVVTRS